MTRGFSLMETVIVVGIVALVAVPLTDLLRGYYALFTMQETVVEVDTSASAAIDEVRAAALQANRVVSSHAFSGATYASGTTTLVLRLPSVDASGTILPGAYDYVGFYATGTTAYRATDAAAGSMRQSGTKRLSGVLRSLAFTYNNADVTRATSTAVDVVTHATSSKGQPLERHLSEQIRLRNI